MPKEKVSKSTTQSTTTSQSGQPVKQKVKTSKPKKEVVSATKVVEEKSEVPVVVEQSVSTETDVVVGDNLECLMQDFVAKIQQVSLQTTSLKQEFKVLEKKVLQRLKQAEKASKKKKTTNRKPSGFVKPALISNELASFLGKPKGAFMARTEVTREINKYIQENNLKDPTNGRKILADAKLKGLLNLNNEELTYFNLQKFMSPHFPKPQVVSA